MKEHQYIREKGAQRVTNMHQWYKHMLASALNLRATVDKIMSIAVEIGVPGVGLLFGVLFFMAVAINYGAACSRGVYAWGGVLDALLVAGVLWLILWSISCKMCETRIKTALLLAIFTFVAHLVVIRLTHALCDQTMYSDFLRVQRCVESETVMYSHRPMFFYWCNFELLVSILGKIFCRELVTVQYLNAIACSTAVFVFYLMAESIAGKAWAIFSSILFCCAPSMLMYSMMTTSEIIGMSLLLSAVWCFVEMVRRIGDNPKSSVSLACGCGVLVGALQLMKPVAVLFIIATGVLSIWKCMKLHSKRKVLFFVGLYLLVLVAYKVTFCAGQSAFSALAGGNVELKGNMCIARTLAVGLNVESKGQFSSEFVSKLNRMSDNEAWAYLGTSVKRDFGRYPKLFAQKFGVLYGNEWWGFGCFAGTLKPRKLSAWIQRMSASWYFLYAGLALVGGIGFLIMMCKREIDEIKLIGGVAVLVVLLFTFMEMLIEVQGRYRSVVYPFYFLLVPYCRFLCNHVTRWILKEKTKSEEPCEVKC